MARRPTKDHLYNEGEAADLLRRSTRTLQYWRHVGGGPRYLKAGRRVLYRGRDLEAFVECNLRTSTRDPDPNASSGVTTRVGANANGSQPGTSRKTRR